MKKIFLALVLTGLSGFVLLGCGGEPRSVEEFEKLSDEDLNKVIKQCKDENYEKETEKYLTTGKASKKFLECENAFKARDKKGMSKGFIPQGF